MVLMSGGQAVVKTLISLGARSGFGVPGESYLAVLDAFCDAPGFRFIGCRNEGGAAFMAEAWAKLTGEVGLCFVTRGPGATNASIGVHTAMQASTPMLLFVGQVGLEHQGREAFQELDYRQVFGPIAKYATEITDVSRTPEIIRRAWSMAISGRPGPVVVALPEDVLTQSAEIEIPTTEILAPKSAAVAADLEQLAAKLQSAERPVILAGGGRWDAQDRSALQACAHKLNIPVVTGFRYHDLFDNTDPLFVGEAGVGMTANTKRVLTEADAVLAVNLRFGEMTTDAFTLFGANRGAQWIAQSHRSGDEFHKYVAPNLSMISDPAPLLQGLMARLEAPPCVKIRLGPNQRVQDLMPRKPPRPNPARLIWAWSHALSRQCCPQMPSSPMAQEISPFGPINLCSFLSTSGCLRRSRAPWAMACQRQLPRRLSIQSAAWSVLLAMVISK